MVNIDGKMQVVGRSTKSRDRLQPFLERVGTRTTILRPKRSTPKNTKTGATRYSPTAARPVHRLLNRDKHFANCMTRTLLEKAKAVPAPKKLKRAMRDGALELILAYCRGEITLRKYWVALRRHPFRIGAPRTVRQRLAPRYYVGAARNKNNHSKPYHEK